ncbi:hypothetical protein ABZ671_17485 [Micromonospora sp. NPDC006766]|uniref:hypothetical protein n=1 Tax=Micromonospora sp. NPDC006766 TaxID=3154778 RepID=UPI00340D611B
MKQPSTAQLEEIRKGVRTFSILANRHPGGSLSSVEAMTVLFFAGVAEIDPRRGPDRDYFVQSKGHAASPLVFCLWAQGLIDASLDEVLRYGEFGSSLPRMLHRDSSLGIDLGTGSLGQGLSFGLGQAIALRKQDIDRRVYVLLGDGECTEGQVWEAAITAERLKMRNLVALVDANGSGSLIKLDRATWADRWSGFKWHTQVVDGHDVSAIQEALLAAAEDERPSAIILHTVKGKGLIPGFEGSNQLSSSVPDEAIPSDTSHEAIIRAASIIRELRGNDHRADHTPTTIVADLAPMLRSSAVGSLEVTKKVGGSIAADLQDLSLIFMAPDAIRNSGIMEHMDAVGSWDWDNPTSNVLQLAIAEQDGVSLAAGMTSCGVTGVVFSMEAFYWRALDQIRQSIAFAGIPAVLIGTSGGLGDLLGAMVQSDRFLAVLRQMIDLDILEAADANQARAFFVEALQSRTPTYIRLPHEAVPVAASTADYLSRNTADGYEIHLDYPEPDVVFLTAGAMLPKTLQAAQIVHAAGELRCRVIEVYGIHRFSRLDSARRSDLIPAAARRISVHNAPSSILGDLLGGGGHAIGVDDWGIAGEDLNELYVTYSMDAQSIARLAMK